MANTKISALTANTNPTGNEEFVYAYNNANGKITLDTMKTFVWWAGITTLNADANIWELNDGFYETTYDLYYKSGEALTRTSATGSTWKRMLFVIKQSTWERAFLAYSISTFSTAHTGRAFYWYSISSSEWNLITLWSRDWALKQYWGVVWASQSNADSLQPDTISQVLSNVSWSVWINISTSNPPYPWVTYTIVVSSVSAAYDVDKKIISVAESFYENKLIIVNPKDLLEADPDISELPKIGVLAQIKMKIDMPNVLEIITMLFVFSAEILGSLTLHATFILFPASIVISTAFLASCVISISSQLEYRFCFVWLNSVTVPKSL
mgnify:CR=1 FL=1